MSIFSSSHLCAARLRLARDISRSSPTEKERRQRWQIVRKKWRPDQRTKVHEFELTFGGREVDFLKAPSSLQRRIFALWSQRGTRAAAFYYRRTFCCCVSKGSIGIISPFERLFPKPRSGEEENTFMCVGHGGGKVRRVLNQTHVDVLKGGPLKARKYIKHPLKTTKVYRLIELTSAAIIIFGLVM